MKIARRRTHRFSATTIAALAGAALPLYAQPVVATKAICPDTYLSDPTCWQGGVSPISTEQLLYSISDTLGGIDLHIDVPNTLNSFGASYDVFVYRNLTILNNARLSSIKIDPVTGGAPIDVVIGNMTFQSSVPRMTLMPGSSLDLVSPKISGGLGISWGDGSDGLPNDPISLTIDTPTILNTDLRYTYSLDQQPVSIDFPSTTSITLRDPFEFGFGWVTIDAPVLEELIGESLVVLPNSPGFSFNAPNLQRITGIRFELEYTNPTGLNTPPLEVQLPIVIDVAVKRAEPLVITQLGNISDIRINGADAACRISFPNLTSAGALVLAGHSEAAEFPDLLLFSGLLSSPERRRQHPSALPASLSMPLADVTPDAGEIEIRGSEPTFYDRVDLRSLSSLPIDSDIEILEGATVRFDSLAQINDATVQVSATFEAPFPTITSLDRSVFRIAGDTEIIIDDPVIDVDDIDPFVAGPGTRMNFVGTESLLLQGSLGVPLIATGGSIDMPALTSILQDGGSLGTLEVVAVGEGASIRLSGLADLNGLRVNSGNMEDLFAYVDNGGTPIISLDAADIPEITTSNSFRGRLVMPAQSALTSDHLLRGNGFVMPNVSSVDSPTIILAANPDTPFVLDLSGGPQFTTTTISTIGPGTIDIPTVTPNISVGLDGGPVRFTGDVTSPYISGSGTIQIEGNLLPAQSNPQFHRTIQMIGDGARTISPIRGDVGADAVRFRRGLTVGSPATETRLHLVPRPESDFEGTFYLGPVAESPAGLYLHPGSELYLNNVPAYLWVFVPELNAETYIPLADLIPTGARCTDLTDGRLCINACPADLNNDIVLDFGDINTFVDLFLAADPRADLNTDGIVDFGDISTFLALFLAGC